MWIWKMSHWNRVTACGGVDILCHISVIARSFYLNLHHIAIMVPD